MKSLYLMMFAGFLTACATTYSIPEEEAPPEWRDEGDPMAISVIKGTTTVNEGMLSKDDVLLEFAVENERVAIIENELKWRGEYGVQHTIPAGSPAYARQFSLIRSYTRSPLIGGTNLNLENNPIEWCVPRPEDVVCIFWEGPDRAHYIRNSTGVTLYANPKGTTGTPGPMPVISERDEVDFGREMQIRSVITRVNKREMRVSTRIYEGDDWTSFTRRVNRVEWENGYEQPLRLFGVEYRVSATPTPDGEISSVEIEIIEAPDDIDLEALSAAAADFRKQLLRALQEAAEAQSEEENSADDSTFSPSPPT